HVKFNTYFCSDIGIKLLGKRSHVAHILEILDEITMELPKDFFIAHRKTGLQH
uniref:Uncharacterized protein n=1 Tax=Ciona savignyi TaxID=51511 RepID=H2YF01_CIOSA